MLTFDFAGEHFEFRELDYKLRAIVTYHVESMKEAQRVRDTGQGGPALKEYMEHMLQAQESLAKVLRAEIVASHCDSNVRGKEDES